MPRAASPAGSARRASMPTGALDRCASCVARIGSGSEFLPPGVKREIPATTAAAAPSETQTVRRGDHRIGGRAVELPARIERSTVLSSAAGSGPAS